MTDIIVNIVADFPEETFSEVKIPTSELEEKLTILYVPIPRNANLSLIDSILNHLPLKAKSPDVIVFRFHKPDIERLEKEKNTHQINLVSKRFKRASIHLLTWNDSTGDYDFSYQNFSSKFSFRKEEMKKWLRHAELKAIISQPNVLLSEDENFHYVFSNGNHYRKFLRVGNALYSKGVLDSYCFWVLPYLSSRPLILLDSNSILSLGLNIVHYYQDCHGGENNNWFGNVECLSNYSEPDTEILKKLSKISYDGDTVGSVLNIYSARGTGSLSNRIQGICDELELNVVGNVILYSVSEETSNKEEVFCLLDSGFKGFKEPDCKECQNNSVGIGIDDKTYSMDLPAESKPVDLNRKSTEETSNFFKKYNHTKSFRIHMDQHDGQRHHMIHVDLKELLKHEKFRQRVVSEAEKLKGTVDCILCPNHDAAYMLSTVINEVVNVEVIRCDHDALVSLSTTETGILKQSRNILIVDDVVITGTRLNEYLEFLDRSGIRNSDTDIKLFVGLARPETESELDGIKDYVYPRSNFICAEKLLLPNWQEDLCPWCWEERQLQNSDGELVADDYILARYNKLINHFEGITDDLFLKWDSVGVKHGARFTIFGDTQDEVEIFVAISSVVQTMRSSKILNDVRSPSKLISKVHSVEKYLKGRYYEDFIRACILRTSVKSDIVSPRIEPKLKKIVFELIHNTKHSRVFVPELILNMAERKIPFLEIEDKVFDGKNQGVNSFLNFLLKKVDKNNL